jgi:Protein kinase domain/AAA ATPase domain
MPPGRARTDDLDTFERALADAGHTAATLERRVQVQAVLEDVLGIESVPPVLDRYVIERKVGAGGMGVVFRGRAASGELPVAIKVIARSAQLERVRFAREVQMLRELACPGLVRYLDHGTTAEGLDYLVTEWLEGEDLGARLRKGTLAVHDALEVARQVARALGAIHERGIIHRDIKPANVMLVGGRLDDVRVIDLGIARSLAPSTQLTATGALLGTPHYMAPEQIRGQVDARSDVYALGATLFEMLAGRPPFVGEHAGAIVLSVLAEAPPSLGSLRRDVPGAVDAVIGRMLAKDPGDRPVDMQAVASELAQLGAELARGALAPVVLSRAERTLRMSAAPLAADAGGLVGRQRVLAQIEGVMAEVTAEQTPALVVVSGDPGAGKSAVLEELAARAGGFRCVRARSQRDQMGVPFSSARALLRSAGGATDRDAAFDQDGEQVDPVLWGDRVILAWLDRFEAWLDAPLLVLVDDADLADLSSLRLLDRAFAQFVDRPFVVVVTQSSAASATIGAHLPEHAIARVVLTPIGDRSALMLAARWAKAASQAAHERVVRIAAGNPAHLRELCRALDHGDEIDTRSAAQLVWVRLGGLDPELRRTLRAAAIVGRVLWPSAVARLLGLPAGDAGLARRLATAIAGDTLRACPSSRIAGEAQLEFTSELGFLAAYELTGDEDRRAAHRTVAEWLAEHAPGESALRAHHLDAAEERAAAAPHYLAAARAALAGGDPRLFEESLARAMGEDAPRETAGEAHALRASARFWRGNTREAVESSRDALRQLTPGSRAWFEAASTGITAAGQLGDQAALHALADDVVATPARSADGAEARVIAALRALSQLLHMGKDLEICAALYAVAESLPRPALGPEARAWSQRVACGYSVGLDHDASAVVEAHRAHVEHGDLRSAAQMGIYLCSLYVWAGNWERAREVIEDAMRIAKRLAVDYLVLWATYAESKLLVETAPYPEARAALERVIAGSDASPRIRAGALVYAALAAARAAEHASAVELAAAARTAHAAPIIAAAAAAAAVRSLLALGRHADAEGLAPQLAAHAAAQERTPEFDELVRLAWAELAAAGDDPETAARAAQQAEAAVMARADTLTDPLRRNGYLARPHLVVATLALAAKHRDRA